MPTKGTPKKNSKPQDGEKKPKTKEKKETPVRPTVVLKHAQVLKKTTENIGKGKKPTVEQAAKDLGYSESYARSGALTKTKSWKQMLDQYLPESKLLDLHDKQLNSWKLQSMLFQKQVSDADIFELMETVNCVVKKVVEIPTGKLVFYICPDNQSRNKALEMGLKLHKRLTDKVEIRDTTPYSGLSDAELAEKIKQGKNFFTKKSEPKK